MGEPVMDIFRMRQELIDWERKYAALAAAVRKHRDFRGDDRCWQDDEELYKALPEGYTPPRADTEVELANCRKFVATRHCNPATTYVSPQRRIEQLEEALDALLDGFVSFDEGRIMVCVARGDHVEDLHKLLDEGN